MTSVLFLLLALQAPEARADLANLAKSAQAQSQAASTLLNSMIQELPNCSKYHVRINSEALRPALSKTKGISEKLAATLALLGTNECANQKTVSKSAEAMFQEMNKLHGTLQGKRGLLLQAFEADPKYKNCVPKNPADKHSTPGALDALALIDTVTGLRGSLKKLAADSKKTCANRSAASIESGGFVIKAGGRSPAVVPFDANEKAEIGL